MYATNITADELRKIAWILVDRHGSDAFDMTAIAIAEMRDAGDKKRISAWEALQSVIADALEGHLQKTRQITLH
ncbi:MAG: hypothetical protein JKY46_05650 [Robiginitomaculum sp.]|nr:hypothetical protein [Robiginitomaculum sp.]